MAKCYHVQFLEGELSEQYIQDQATFVTIGQLSCIHYDISDLFLTLADAEDEENRAFLFIRNESSVQGIFHNVFSVPSGTRFPTLKNRAVVEYIGEDSGMGQWKCNRDGGAISCIHIISARHCLQQHVKGDWNAEDASIEGNIDPQDVRFGEYVDQYLETSSLTN